MIFVIDENQTPADLEKAQAHSLRRYLMRRASGLKAPEYSYGGMAIERDRALAQALPYRTIRQAGAPWCEWLGLDVSINSDPYLTAFFTLSTPNETDPEADYRWQRLLKECQKDRIKTLRKWRQAGLEALTLAATQRAAPIPDKELAKAKVAPKYAKRGLGGKKLKAIANAKSQRGRA